MTDAGSRQGRVAGKVAVVTGASRGIGRACAEALAREGARGLVLGYRQDEVAAREVEAACAVAGAEVLLERADLAQPEAGGRLIARALERFGRIDVLVNNAGLARDQLCAELSDEDLEAMLALDVAAPVRLCRAVIRPMLRQRAGSIINLSSVAARQPGRGNSAYAGCKGFVESFTRALAVELGRKGVRVNAIAPGVIETAMSAPLLTLAAGPLRERIALGRFGRPEEVAALCLFLASDEACYLSGAVLAVDGGFLGP